MNVVYFSDELAARAPGIFHPLCIEPGGKAVTLGEVIAAIMRREPVSIRPATNSEMRRADAFVAQFEIGLLLGEKLSTLLDQDPPEVASGAITALREALESGPFSRPEFLDRRG